MVLLNKNQYAIVIDRLSTIPINTLFARAVLELKTSGRVFVDNTEAPKTFYIAHSYGMSLLFGDTENTAFNTSLADYMLNTNGHRVKQEWLQVYPEKWNEKLNELLHDKIINYSKIEGKYSRIELDMFIEKNRKSHVLQWSRINFNYRDDNKIVNVGPEYNIKIIDSDIYDRIEGSVIPKYFWNSKEHFLSDGMGYALMKGRDIVSIAFSSYIFENQLEIGVETSEKYREMGLAKYACEAMLAYCKTNKYLPIWACRKENIGSYRLAKSLGFEESLILPYYELVR
jgi:hypothetical protein